MARDNEMTVTLSANTVRVQISGDELVLEFGRFVPDEEHPVPPLGHPPDVRVVIPRALARPLLDVLRQHAPVSCTTDLRVN
jgi:hypothetical protein